MEVDAGLKWLALLVMTPWHHGCATISTGLQYSTCPSSEPTRILVVVCYWKSDQHQDMCVMRHIVHVNHLRATIVIVCTLWHVCLNTHIMERPSHCSHMRQVSQSLLPYSNVPCVIWSLHHVECTIWNGVNVLLLLVVVLPPLPPPPPPSTPMKVHMKVDTEWS